MSLSVCIITRNEEANILRTLKSVKTIADEVIVVDSGSTDRTVALAESFGAKVFIEEWKGFAPQKNSAMAKATSEWVLSLDADEEVSPELANSINALLKWEPSQPEFDGYMIARRNIYMGRWIKRSGYYPDRKLRLVRPGRGQFEPHLVHESMQMEGKRGTLQGDLIHYAYPRLEDFIEHANRYSSLGAQMVVHKRKGKIGFSIADIVFRPLIAFIYRYFLRRGFLDGREGLLVHLNHAAYMSWKYAKAWELAKSEVNVEPVRKQ